MDRDRVEAAVVKEVEVEVEVVEKEEEEQRDVSLPCAPNSLMAPGADPPRRWHLCHSTADTQMHVPLARLFPLQNRGAPRLSPTR